MIEPNFRYVWKPEIERLYANKDPQKVAEEILSIGENPTNAQIVDKARNEETELHDLFEWNDNIAAEKYRESQAHRIVTSLQIVKVGLNEDRDEKPVEMKPVRMLYHLDGQPGYVPVMKIMNDAVMHNQLLNQAYDELRAFKRKYSILQELQPIFDMIP